MLPLIQQSQTNILDSIQQAYRHIINTTLLSQDTPIDTSIYHVTTLLLIQQANMLL